jgi:HNH endonuclease/Helix-turn-helix domain of resolvase
MPKGVFHYGRPPIKFSEADRFEMRRLYESGYALHEIAAIFEISLQTLGRRLRADGITIRKRGRQSDRARAKYSGEKHPLWKGGRMFHRGGGYWLVRCPNHPHQRDGYIYEHRFVMENHLRVVDPNNPALDGGYLKPDYVVHHKNGNKTDNRIENLEVMSRQRHSSWIHYSEQLATLKAENERLAALLAQSALLSNNLDPTT